MDVSWTVKYITEFIGTALLILLGNGAVSNVELAGTKGNKSGWLVIAWGFGFGVMIPALAFGTISAQINPALTLGLAVVGEFPWTQVAPYIIAQLLGAMVGQLIIVLVHLPFYKQTRDSDAILGSFATISAVDDGTRTSRIKAMVNGGFGEFFGSFVLFFCAMGLTKLFYGYQSIDLMKAQYSQQGGLPSGATGEAITHMYSFGGQAVGALGLGFLVVALVTSLGGPTGPGLNPARDFGPRLVHWFLPQSVLGENKLDSKWWYAWVPGIIPIVAGIAAVALFKLIFGM